jgi:putative cardiolipin synthase
VRAAMRGGITLSSRQGAHIGRGRVLALAGVPIMLVLAGCASIPKNVERTPSTAFNQPETTRMGQYFAKYTAQHPGKSGFRAVPNGRDAFTLRVGLADIAERSLDLQYYIWESDTTGKILAAKLVAAANRGVHVRILIDDNNFQDRDFGTAALDLHPNIEIRAFNPFANRGTHALDFLTSFSRVNQRMHNKVMIADATVAVVGGRNIGDHYFGVNEKANFRDLDLAAVGPIVANVASSFDTYWNSVQAYPIAALHEEKYTPEDIERITTDVKQELAEHPYPWPVDQEIDKLIEDINRVAADIVWADGRVLVDDPGKLASGGSEVVKHSLIEWLNSTQKELLIESAYFVPRMPSVRGLGAAIDRGVKVRVLTNSLASNDVAAAHAGYEKFRDDMLEEGVDIFELRPDAGLVRKEWSIVGGRSIAALHTKAIVVDRQSTFVGSFNLDPRSANINTEIGLLVDSPELASQVAAYMDEGVEPDNAYHVTLDEHGRIRWTADVDGKNTVFEHEPETSGWKRFTADFIKMLPVESQL